MKLGRITLKTPREADPVVRNMIEDGRMASGRSNPGAVGYGSKGYLCEGLEHGAAIPALRLALLNEAQRLGAVWVVDDSGDPALPTGHYLIQECAAPRKKGQPYKLRWNLQLVEAPLPTVTRQAEDDNVAGADTSDSTADRDGFKKVVYTPTTSEILILDPRNVAGAEAFNLPAGTYRAILRAYQVTNSSAKWRVKTTKLDGTVITTGSQVAVGAAGAWTDLDLGTFTITATDAGANWYQVHVQGVAAELGDTWTDRLRFVPV